MDQNFDAAANERIEKMQRKERPKPKIKFINTVLSDTVNKNKNRSSTTPYSPDDVPASSPLLPVNTPTSSQILEKQPERAPSLKKKREMPRYEPSKNRGLYGRLSGSKSSNQFPDLTSNSSFNKHKTDNTNAGVNYARNKNCTKNSFKNCDSDVAVLEDCLGKFSDNHLIKLNHDSKKNFHNNKEFSSIIVCKKIDKNDDISVSDVSGENCPDKFSDNHLIKLNNDPQKIIFYNNKELSSITVCEKIDKNDISVSDVPEVLSDLGSLSINEDFFNVSDCTQQSVVLLNHLDNVPELSSYSDEFFIPPPTPVPTSSETLEVFKAEPSSKNHQFLNSNLSKDHFQHLEDNVSEKQSIPPNKSDLQVCDDTSYDTSKNNLVFQRKTTISSGDNEVSEVQSTVSSEDDQELIKKINEFFQQLEHDRSMQKTIAEKIMNDLKKVLKYYFNGNTVKLYGSYWYGAAITTSNINFALVTDPPIKNNFLLCMQKTLAKEMKGYKVSPFEEEINPRRSKICFIDNQHGISCELIYLGTRVSNYIDLSNMLKAIFDFNPEIRKLVMATKLWAEACEICEAENGKLHPVGFILLVLHYLQQLETPLLPLLEVSSRNWGLNGLTVRNNSSVGELWLGFLKYYSYDFNWSEYVVTVTDKKPVPKSTKLWEISWIGIEDPISKKNIADSVIISDTAEFITFCFKTSYQNFISDPFDSDSTSSSGSDQSGSRNNCRSYTFKLSDCISRPPPIFCSDDDSDYESYVPQRSAVEESLKFSKISRASLKYVDQVLEEAYNDFILPENQVNGREAFVIDLERYIRKLYSDANLKLFGSTVNGFGFKRSDLDICMTFSGKYRKNCNPARILKKLVYHLRRRDDLKNVFGLYSAQIPIIKFNFTTQNWNCDLSFYNVLAVHNSKLLNKYSMMDEKCRILGVALKLLAKKTCLADCSSSSLSSYSYILMVIHFLQQVNPPVLPVMPIDDKEVFEKEIDEKDLERKGVLKNRNYWFFEDTNQLRKRYLGNQSNSSTIGELWLDMLEYYLKFDYERAVSITEKDPVPSSSLQRYARLINIEDPFISKRNLGCIVSEGKREETRKIFHRARMLFGSDYSSNTMKNLQEHYFSPSNLTGRIMKNIECSACGGFGHESKDCPKADPFKNRKPWNPNRKRIRVLNKMNTRNP